MLFIEERIKILEKELKNILPEKQTRWGTSNKANFYINLFFIDKSKKKVVSSSVWLKNLREDLQKWMFEHSCLSLWVFSLEISCLLNRTISNS